MEKEKILAAFGEKAFRLMNEDDLRRAEVVLACEESKHATRIVIRRGCGWWLKGKRLCDSCYARFDPEADASYREAVAYASSVDNWRRNRE